MTMTPPADERVSSDVRGSRIGGQVDGHHIDEATTLAAGGAPDRARSERGPEVRTVLAGGLVVGILAVLVRVAASPLGNTDSYFHLRFGAEFLHHWSLREPGSVSTFATRSWLPTQWLPEVGMAQMEAWFGLAGVAWLFGVQLVSLALGLYVVARRWVAPLTAGLLVVVALVASSSGLSMRPQTWSFLLVAITTAAWFRTREDGRLRWWLVPLTWLWAMVHGMWPLAIGIGLVAIAGLALDRPAGRPSTGGALLVPGLSAVAAALTPVGPQLYGAVLVVGSRRQYFSEWSTPDFTRPSVVVLGAFVVLTVVVMARQGRRGWFDLGFLIVAAACAVWSWRTVPVSAMVLVPLAARQIGAARDARPRRVVRRERALLVGAAVLALTALAAVVPQTSDEPPPQPSWVDPTLSALPPGTQVFGEWDWGGYLLWRYPQLDLLMHGYGDTFTDAELQRNTDITAMAPGWDEQLRATGCTIAVLRPNDPVAYALEHQLHWIVVHESETIEELRAPAGWPAG
jgi:hypothetical protein